MGLRKQILLLAFVTLVLPWAGWEIVREMERVLRQSQVASLTTVAKAAAIHTSSTLTRMPLFVPASQSEQHKTSHKHYFAHPLEAQLTLDGYGEDWAEQGLLDQAQLTATALTDNRMTVSIAQQGELLFILAQVRDDQRQFYNPTNGLTHSDHLILRLEPTISGYSHVHVFSAAVGGVTVQGVTPSGQVHTLHQVAGFWNEELDSYTIELRLPLRWVKGGMRILSVDGADRDGYRTSQAARLLPVLIPSESLSRQLAVFSPKGVQLHLVYKQGWVAATAGDLDTRTASRGINLWVEKLLRLLVGEQRYPEREDLPAGGRIIGDEFERVQERTVRWFNYRGKSVARVVVPLMTDKGGSSWFLAVDQSSESIESLANGVMGRLIFYFLIALTLVLMVLLAYASLLSFRIRQLRTKTQSLVDADGRVKGSFEPERFADEIGDLSRAYAALLKRLHSYNKYLETLSGKLSHELRTPLAIVSTSLDNLSQQGLPSESAVYLKRAHEGTARLSSILRAMSEASRIEQSIQREQCECLDFVGFLQAVVTSYQDAYPGLRLDIGVPGKSVFVEFAPDLVLQLLDKLIDNAAEFAGEDGEVRFDLEEDGEFLSLRVANSGPPLDESKATSIFDSMVSERKEPAGDGEVHLGLGLYIVRLIAEFHKAEITAYNEDTQRGHWVVFELRFPLRGEGVQSTPSPR